MRTIPEVEEIAKKSTAKLAEDFAELGWKNPPVITPGIVWCILHFVDQPPTPPMRKDE